MKSIQIESESGKDDNNELLRFGGVKRIHAGWYTCHFNGVVIDKSTIQSAKYNRGGKLVTQ
jgi:hypothetical protein